jgi:hypothetical protein
MMNTYRRRHRKLKPAQRVEESDEFGVTQLKR